MSRGCRCWSLPFFPIAGAESTTLGLVAIVNFFSLFTTLRQLHNQQSKLGGWNNQPEKMGFVIPCQYRFGGNTLPQNPFSGVISIKLEGNRCCIFAASRRPHRRHLPQSRRNVHHCHRCVHERGGKRLAHRQQMKKNRIQKRCV